MATVTKVDKLRLVGLTKRYPSLVAVDRVNLSVPEGEFLTLLGPSGSGKTTTLMMIAGFTASSTGRIQVDGHDIGHLPPEKRNIGVVFQNYALFPHKNTFDNVAFPLKMRKIPSRVIAERVHWALGLVQLENLGDRLPRQLSGGQQQRVALARALVFQPSILLMDEPLGALDKNLREQMKVELKRLHRELRSTIVYVTHDQEEALMMSDRVALMNCGRIEQIGSAMDLYERPSNRFVAEFIGQSNIIEGCIEPAAHGSPVDFVFCADGARIGLSQFPDGTAPGQRSLLVLRPERIGIAPRSGNGNGLNCGTVIDQMYIGDIIRYRIKVGDNLLITVNRQNTGGSYRPHLGDSVRISCAPADACVLPA
ncbi:MAG TPA: ABC transporter ATP-binding protein [Geminicoccaceae bacterium]|nr:ABC transporter ATP-binding protein [Geminicoccaceae bacterium]